MSSTYLLSPMAEADLADIWVYTSQEWSLEQAESYTNDIIDTFEAIADGKTQGRRVEINDEYLKVLVGRHAFNFRLQDDMIAIVRILHQSMDVERFL